MIRQSYLLLTLLLGILLSCQGDPEQKIYSHGEPAQLEIRPAAQNSIRITLKPLSYPNSVPYSPALARTEEQSPVITLREISGVVKKQVGNLFVEVHPDPLTVSVSNADGELVQEIAFQNDGKVSFDLDDQPVLGLGEGGPRAQRDRNWREQEIEFDRRGRLHKMEPRWQSDAYGSRNPVAMLVGTGGWGLFMATPWSQVDLSEEHTGSFIPWPKDSLSTTAQSRKNQHEQLGKGIHPVDSLVDGLYDLFVFDAQDPSAFMKDVSIITGPAVMPPKWTMGYMQSHRTLEDEDQMINIVDTFREKQIPVDAVIYLGTGFTPRGWNTWQPSFEYNPEVFKRKGEEVIADLHERNVKVVLHIVPEDRDELPTLHGNIPPESGAELDSSHIAVYWKKHEGLMEDGVDGFWPDEGDWFNLFERMKRHQMYYQGPLATEPGIRPWSLHRNGHLGIAKWGGWVWSGDTSAAWKTLEGQIAVGLNHSLSLSPFWGSDIGGFYPNAEKTGELYARWVQFAAFCPSFRSHSRTWQLGLPWGWGMSDMGVVENNNSNTVSEDSERNILQSELNNPKIEPVAKKYIELRYQLLPYNYTLAWQARQTGMPMMRAMWLHYPEDPAVRDIGDQYLWGRDMLIAPVYEKDAQSRELYLPEGLWYDWWTNESFNGGDRITRKVDLGTMPIYVRAGAIIPFDPVRQYTAQEIAGPTSLRIYEGADGHFELYQDDGISLGYLKGENTRTSLSWNDENNTLSIAPSAGNMETGSKSRTFEVRLYPSGRTANIVYSGAPVEVKL